MLGGIYTREHCSQCGKTLRYVKGKGCVCSEHPGERSRTFIVAFPGNIHINFTNLEAAEQMLNHLRVEKATRRERFNPDDYKTAKPNSFIALKDKYLAKKRAEGLETIGKITYYINRAAESDLLGPKNLRDINGADIEDYLYSITKKNGKPISEKTRYNHCTQLHDFWTWALRRGNIITLAEFPNFPVIDYELGYRKITDWPTQQLILDKVKELTYKDNPKIWLGIWILCLHTKLRPEDLRRCKENSLRDGILFIPKPTKLKNKFKQIRLHPDIVEAWLEIQRKYPALPEAYFFRHTEGYGQTPGERFGERLFNTWFKRAAIMVDPALEGLTLYGGTKHTTSTETARVMGEESAIKMSGLTNKAAKRYIMVDDDGTFEIVRAAAEARKKATVVPFRRQKKVGE